MKFLLKLCAMILVLCAVIFGAEYVLKEKIYIKPYNDIVKEISKKYEVEENMMYENKITQLS